METKKQIRSSILAKRRALSREEWESKSEKIQNTLFAHPWYQEAEDIYCYVDYNKEVGTRAIMEQAWKDEKRVWVPKVHGVTMDFYLIESFSDLESGAYGILEPVTEQMAEATEGLMIQPGVGFDRACHRLGYGGGFYDRYLEEHPNLRKIALAFEVQIAEELPTEETDICPDYVITEVQTIKRN